MKRKPTKGVSVQECPALGEYLRRRREMGEEVFAQMLEESLEDVRHFVTILESPTNLPPVPETGI